MLVFRIEDAHGKGMYWGGGLWDKAVGARADTKRHPCPQEDSRLWGNYIKRPEVVYDFHFGFSSISQLRAWLYQDEWLECMHELGGVLKVHDVDDEHVVLGNAQVMFLKGRANSVGHYSLHPSNIRELQANGL